MGLFGDSIQKFKGQNHKSLKADLKKLGLLFEDPEFPATTNSIYFKEVPASDIEWKRPKDISADPHLFVEGVDRNDITQGSVGNCWFIAACSSLATNKEIWHKVIPDHKEQEWDKPEDYVGMFYFRFWRFGEWVEVVIDDRLPTLGGKLMYVHSRQQNEFWAALLEKAYAKLNGCYEALDQGDLSEALEDFTGGCTETIDLSKGGYEIKEKRDKLFKQMKHDVNGNALLAAAIPPQDAAEMEKITEEGLVKGHAYGITGVATLKKSSSGNFFKQLFTKSEEVDMIRLRNPWGEVEWKGAFSDNSEEWKAIPAKDKERLGINHESDGEFWMTAEDFCRYFVNLAVCRQINTSILSLSHRWHEAKFFGTWSKPNLAGGCPKNQNTFLQNPQYIFDIESDSDALISIMQNPARSCKGNERLFVGFSLFKVEINRTYKAHRSPEHIDSSQYKNARSQLLRVELMAGRYLVVPATFDPGFEGQFLLRIYTKDGNHAKELTQHAPSPNCLLACCCGRPRVITQVNVVKACGLERLDRMGGADPYVIIKCGRETVESRYVQDTLNPVWNAQAVFYRSNVQKQPVVVQVWNHNIVKDEFMGEATFKADNMSGNVQAQETTLWSRGKNAKSHPGKIMVTIESHTDITAL